MCVYVRACVCVRKSVKASKFKFPSLPQDPLRKIADVQDAGQINKTKVLERTVRVESLSCKKH